MEQRIYIQHINCNKRHIIIVIVLWCQKTAVVFQSTPFVDCQNVLDYVFFKIAF